MNRLWHSGADAAGPRMTCIAHLRTTMKLTAAFAFRSTSVRVRPKNAFLYLLSFSMLATCTIGLGSVMFTLIDRWIRDSLGPVNNYYSGGYYQMADSLACMIVAFPVYLLTMRAILREVRLHPEKLDSPVRKWLSYIALLIAAGVVVGDLISFLTYFLRGELTARFIAKIFVVLVIAGGVFWYYLGSLQKGVSAARSKD